MKPPFHQYESPMPMVDDGLEAAVADLVAVVRREGMLHPNWGGGCWQSEHSHFVDDRWLDDVRRAYDPRTT